MMESCSDKLRHADLWVVHIDWDITYLDQGSWSDRLLHADLWVVHIDWDITYLGQGSWSDRLLHAAQWVVHLDWLHSHQQTHTEKPTTSLSFIYPV